MLYDSELEESDALEPRALSPVNGDSGEEDSTSEFLRQRTQWPRRIGSSDEESPPSARTSMERGSPGLSEEAKAIIEDTYRSVWTEFYEWEPSHCTSTLQSLASELSDEPASFDFGLEDGDWCVEAHWTGDVVSEHSDVDDLLSASNQFDVWQWTSYGTVHKGTTAPAVAIVVEDGATPHPRYEACTPTDFPIDPETHGEAPHCSFIKYAGMPGFDEKRYLRLFTSIEWQQPWRDPDREPG
ncbi:hypothetical protein BC835DRAFT_985859 [Cytidiella melzeri]|nr:hypothetical protein BC835DRAFT_985859 [Cytidiella melzeri]